MVTKCNHYWVATNDCFCLHGTHTKKRQAVKEFHNYFQAVFNSYTTTDDSGLTKKAIILKLKLFKQKLLQKCLQP